MTVQQGPSLGEFLRQEREKRGITIEQVASATKIAVRVLHCLESDQYAELPAKPFIRGFVISYVRFIGLDSKEVLTRFGAFIENKAADRPTRDQGHSGYAFERRETEQSRMMLWFILGGFVLIGGVLLLILKPTLHRHKSARERFKTSQLQRTEMVAPSASPSPMASPVPEPSLAPMVQERASPAPIPVPQEKFLAPARPLVLLEPVVQPAPSSAAPVTAKVAPSPTPSISPRTSPNDPLNSGADMPKEEIRQRVVFRAVEDVWVRYQSDDRKPMRFILRKDKMLILRAHDLIKFQASDPKGVRFSYAGHPGKLMSDEKSAAVRQGDLTLVFPTEMIENIKEPFPGTKSIFMSPVPPSPALQPSPSPRP